MTPRNIVGIRVYFLWETCERTTYYVELLTDEGFTMTPAGHRTGSNYEEGLSKDEARERALIDAHLWGDFLCLPVEPLVEDDITYDKPKRAMSLYTTRRVLAERKAAKQ